MRSFVAMSLWLVPAVLMYLAYVLFRRLGTNRRSLEDCSRNPSIRQSDPTAIPWSEGSFVVGSSWQAIANPQRLLRSLRQCSWQWGWGLLRCSPFEMPV